MTYSITDTFKMKREILNCSKKFSTCLSSHDAKFTADMTYGIVASKSCLLTHISQRLQENTKKRYTVDRLSNHLARGIPTAAKRDVYLVLVYGITEHPMMLVTNKAISGKKDVIKIARLYFSRWRIEKYFRAKSRNLPLKTSVYGSSRRSTH